MIMMMMMMMNTDKNKKKEEQEEHSFDDWISIESSNLFTFRYLWYFSVPDC